MIQLIKHDFGVGFRLLTMMACVLAVVGVLVSACGGSSGGPPTHRTHAPQDGETRVIVNGVEVDIAKTNIDGYTCFVGVNHNWYDDYSPTLWCDTVNRSAP